MIAPLTPEQRHELRHCRLATPDLWAVQEAVADQVAGGHTAETDAEHSVGYIADKCVELAQLARAVAHDGNGQKLEIAYRRAARAAACNMALMRRIRLEQANRMKKGGV